MNLVLEIVGVTGSKPSRPPVQPRVVFQAPFVPEFKKVSSNCKFVP